MNSTNTTISHSNKLANFFHNVCHERKRELVGGTCSLNLIPDVLAGSFRRKQMKFHVFIQDCVCRARVRSLVDRIFCAWYALIKRSLFSSWMRCSKVASNTAVSCRLKPRPPNLSSKNSATYEDTLSFRTPAGDVLFQPSPSGSKPLMYHP